MKRGHAVTRFFFFQASWDEPSNCVVAHRSDPSSVQKLCNQLSEKLNHLVESNERLLEAMGNKNMHYMFQVQLIFSSFLSLSLCMGKLTLLQFSQIGLVLSKKCQL